jgi:hypothetical protein
LSNLRGTLICEAEVLLFGKDTTDDAKKKWKAKVATVMNPMCECLAHKNEQLYGQIQHLFEIEQPLDDDSGHQMADAIIKLILNKTWPGGKFKYVPVTQGRTTQINFLLQLPSGSLSVYTGTADFIVTQQLSLIERRLGQSTSVVDRTRAVGDIQSPPEKKFAYAQAGIYTIGKIAKQTIQGNVRMATVLFYKDLTAQVALAECLAEKAANGGKGEVSYKSVDSVCGYNLRNPNEFGRFATVFTETLKVAAPSV